MKYTSSSAHQHFPTYQFLNNKNRDIAIAEYESANLALQNEEKIFTVSSNISILAISIFGSILLKGDTFFNEIKNYTDNPYYLFIFLVSNLFISATFIIFFGQKQKELCHAARKVVVLRRLLGISYGRTHMVLPNWKVEGADEPFSIRTYKGSTDSSMFPIYLIGFLSGAIVIFIMANLVDAWSLIALSVTYFIFLIYLYRYVTYDYHENTWLSVARFIAKILNVHLVDNFEYVIYRAKLQVYEVHRQKVGLLLPTKFLIHLEDKTFMTNIGLSGRGMLRALHQYLCKGRLTGGSTITQQLVRTLFIVDIHKGWRRKVVEISFALWAWHSFKKLETAEMHLGAVRFEDNVMGILDAMKYFFGDIKEELTPAQCFFLIERISNIKSKILVNKIVQNINSVKDEGYIKDGDIKELIDIYATQVQQKKIIETEKKELQALREALLS